MSMIPNAATISADLLADCAANPGLAILFGRTRPLSSTWATEQYRRASAGGLVAAKE